MKNRRPEETKKLISTIHERAVANPNDEQLQEEARIIRAYQARAESDLKHFPR